MTAGRADTRAGITCHAAWTPGRPQPGSRHGAGGCPVARASPDPRGCDNFGTLHGQSDWLSGLSFQFVFVTVMWHIVADQ